MDNHIQDLKRNEYKNAHSVYMTQNIQLQVFYAPLHVEEAHTKWLVQSSNTKSNIVYYVMTQSWDISQNNSVKKGRKGWAFPF